MDRPGTTTTKLTTASQCGLARYLRDSVASATVASTTIAVSATTVSTLTAIASTTVATLCGIARTRVTLLPVGPKLP